MSLYFDAPFVPSDPRVIREMLRLANLKKGELLYDLGSGDGRIVFMAAEEFGARAIGVEIREDLVKRAVMKAKEKDLLGRVKFIHGNFFNVDIRDADVVTLFLLTSTNEKLRPKLERELKPGARVVSHEFEIRGWKPDKVVTLNDGLNSHRILLYKII